MFSELELLETDSVLAAYNAVCELVEDTERLQAACAAKEAELAALRGQTAELFGARLAAEGADEDSVTAAMAMWKIDSQSAAQAVLGCDIAEAANPYGCNQYGHGFKEPHGAAGGRGQKTFGFFEETVDKKRKKDLAVVEDATSSYKAARDAEDTAYKKWDGTSYGTPEYKEAKAAWEKAYKKLGEEVKNARRVRNEARKEGYDLDEPVDKEIDELIKSMEESERAWASSRTLEELLVEEDRVNAANPYGCNQYGHEWKGKHGEGWKPSGRGGESNKDKKGEKTETPEARTQRIVVGAIKEAKSVLDELNKAIGKPPYDANDPRARAKVDLEHELTRTQERDTEEAAERLKKVTESAQKVLKQGEKKEAALSNTEAESPKEKSIEEEADEYENSSEKERGLKLFIWKRDLQQAKDKALDIRESSKYRQRDPETVKQFEEAKKDANERAKRLRSTLKAIGERRGWDKKKIDYMLRRYPETVIDF